MFYYTIRKALPSSCIHAVSSFLINPGADADNEEILHVKGQLFPIGAVIHVEGFIIEIVNMVSCPILVGKDTGFHPDRDPIRRRQIIRRAGDGHGLAASAIKTDDIAVIVIVLQIRLIAVAARFLARRRAIYAFDIVRCTPRADAADGDAVVGNLGRRDRRYHTGRSQDESKGPKLYTIEHTIYFLCLHCIFLHTTLPEEAGRLFRQHKIL